MSQPIRACDGHLGFPIDSKNTKLVEGIEDLLPVRFGEIPCNGFRGEVENVSAKSEPVTAILDFKGIKYFLLVKFR